MHKLKPSPISSLLILIRPAWLDFQTLSVLSLFFYQGMISRVKFNFPNNRRTINFENEATLDVKNMKSCVVTVMCCVVAGKLGLLQPPEALQDSHQWLPSGQVGERPNKGPLRDSRVPGWEFSNWTNTFWLQTDRRWNELWRVFMNFPAPSCSSGGGWQTTIRQAGGLLGHRCHHVHPVSL